MNDESRAIPAMVAGAALGALAGYLFFTESGRRMRRQIEPALEHFARELSSFRGAVQRTVEIASEGWGLAGETAERPPRIH